MRICLAVMEWRKTVGLLFLGSAVAGHGKKAVWIPVDSDVDLAHFDKPDVTPPLPPKPKVQQARVATVRAVTTRIVPDDQVQQHDRPPENDAMIDRKIGLTTQNGVADGIDAPPTNGGVMDRRGVG